MNIRRTCVTFALAIAMICALASTGFAASNPFADVPRDHWAYDAITDLAAAGLVEGFPDGMYKGDRTFTRYEMALVFSRTLNRLENLIRDEISSQVQSLRRDLSNETTDKMVAEIERAKAELSQEIRDRLANLQTGGAPAAGAGSGDGLSDAARAELTRLVGERIAERVRQLEEDQADLRADLDAIRAVQGDPDAVRRLIEARTQELADQIVQMQAEFKDELAALGARVTALEQAQTRTRISGSSETILIAPQGSGTGPHWFDPRRQDFNQNAKLDDGDVFGGIPDAGAFGSPTVGHRLNLNFDLRPGVGVELHNGLVLWSDLYDRSDSDPGGLFRLSRYDLQLSLPEATFWSAMRHEHIARSLGTYADYADIGVKDVNILGADVALTLTNSVSRWQTTPATPVERTSGYDASVGLEPLGARLKLELHGRVADAPQDPAETKQEQLRLWIDRDFTLGLPVNVAVEAGRNAIVPDNRAAHTLVQVSLPGYHLTPSLSIGAQFAVANNAFNPVGGLTWRHNAAWTAVDTQALQGRLTYSLTPSLALYGGFENLASNRVVNRTDVTTRFGLEYGLALFGADVKTGYEYAQLATDGTPNGTAQSRISASFRRALAMGAALTGDAAITSGGPTSADAFGNLPDGNENDMVLALGAEYPVLDVATLALGGRWVSSVGTRSNAYAGTQLQASLKVGF